MLLLFSAPLKVFVLDDGGETDLDLGNYERFMGVNLRNESNLTTGYVHVKYHGVGEIELPLCCSYI